MIVSEEKDQSTNKVIDWLKFYKKDYLRINIEDHVEIKCEVGEENSTSLKVREKEYSLREFDSFYYRRGDLNYYLNIHVPSPYVSPISGYFKKEWVIAKNIIYNHDFKLKFGDFNSEISSNKIEDIRTAQEVGFSVPRTILTSSKYVLQSFISDCSEIVIKPLHGKMNFVVNSNRYFDNCNYRIWRAADLGDCPDTFFPIIGQEYINKLFDIRVFCFDGGIFPMAIFSQFDKGTLVDNRSNRLDGKLNRTEPYNLTVDVEKKIRSYLNRTGLTTGSFDFFITENRDIYFLEVNPSGQFDWLSANCNYYIEQYIAMKL